ncbi:UNVERIFIED_ORG: class I SAM-dependent methyltransferase [Bacillus sp. AZ43]
MPYGAPVTASRRAAWAADLVAPAPTDRVLEVGCGHGVLLSLLAGRLTAGVAVGVDRSARMVEAAGRRNRAAVDAGTVRLLTASLTDAPLEESPFDVVVSYDVRAFWTPPAPEWDVIGRVLAPGGRVIVAFSLMAAGAERAIGDAVRRLAAERGLHQVAEHRGRTAPIGSMALELRRDRSPSSEGVAARRPFSAQAPAPGCRSPAQVNGGVRLRT